MSKATSPRDSALAEVELHRVVVARWEAEQAAATAELESLQERAGDEVLADDSAAVRLPRTMQELRDRIDIASRAVAAARPKLEAAGRAVVLAEAAEWDAELSVRQAELDKFDARQGELLDALQAFTGHSWTPTQRESSSGGVVTGDYGGPRVVERSPREPLQNAVRVAERTAWCLREIAAGRDPHGALAEPFEGPMFSGIVPALDPRTFYTASVWGPDAVLPAPAYLRAREAATTDRAESAPTSGPPLGTAAQS